MQIIQQEHTTEPTKGQRARHIPSDPQYQWFMKYGIGCNKLPPRALSSKLAPLEVSTPQMEYI